MPALELPGPNADDEAEDEDLYGAAYEDVTYQDSTATTTRAPSPTAAAREEFDLEHESERLEKRLHFLSTLARLWQIAARTADGGPSGPARLARADRRAGWLATARRQSAAPAGLARRHPGSSAAGAERRLRFAGRVRPPPRAQGTTAVHGRSAPAWTRRWPSAPCKARPARPRRRRPSPRPPAGSRSLSVWNRPCSPAIRGRAAGAAGVPRQVPVRAAAVHAADGGRRAAADPARARGPDGPAGPAGQPAAPRDCCARPTTAADRPRHGAGRNRCAAGASPSSTTSSRPPTRPWSKASSNPPRAGAATRQRRGAGRGAGTLDGAVPGSVGRAQPDAAAVGPGDDDRRIGLASAASVHAALRRATCSTPAS